jgi:hypothetical protein
VLGCLVNGEVVHFSFLEEYLCLRLLNGKTSASSKAYKVVGIGQAATLIKVVDTPDKASLSVAPSAEVLDM